MIDSLKCGASNYAKVAGLHRADGTEITSVTSATGKIFLSSDTTKTALANSLITLTQVDADAEPDAYHGTFPPTVPLVASRKYTVQALIVADGLTYPFERKDIEAD